MDNKIETLKDIRSKTHNLDPRNENFDEQFLSLAREALSRMEGVNDMQEKNWIEKGLQIVESSDGDASPDGEERDRALSYLKEAVHNVILREDNYRS